MIVAFSTSSPLASVALFTSEGELLGGAADVAAHAASGVCLRILQELLKDRALTDVSLFVADLGPGSFTGTRVGVTLAKTFGYAQDAEVAGVDAFDLIALDETVVIPNKRGEWFVREPGEPARLAQELPASFVGYTKAVSEEEPRFPDARRLDVRKLQKVAPELLVPRYLVEPSISTPKKAYGVPHA